MFVEGSELRTNYYFKSLSLVLFVPTSKQILFYFKSFEQTPKNTTYNGLY